MFSNGTLEYRFHGNLHEYTNKETGGGSFPHKLLDIGLTNCNISKLNEFSRFIWEKVLWSNYCSIFSPLLIKEWWNQRTCTANQLVSCFQRAAWVKSGAQCSLVNSGGRGEEVWRCLAAQQGAVRWIIYTSLLFHLPALNLLPSRRIFKSPANATEKGMATR